MIKFINWVLGATADKLRDEQAAAEQDVRVSRLLRRNAERRLSDSMRMEMDRMGAALEPKGHGR